MQLADAREQMIEQQVRAWDVLDERGLEVLRQVPRGLFTPENQRYRAYADVEVPLPCGQHMLRPSVVGRLLQAVLPAAAEQVLEIGAGSGFVTACLRAMAARVSSLELYPELADEARRNLALLGMRDVAVVDADALAGERGERYDVIAITASLPIYDERFERMLNIGGRLFVAHDVKLQMRRLSANGWPLAAALPASAGVLQRLLPAHVPEQPEREVIVVRRVPVVGPVGVGAGAGIPAAPDDDPV